MNRTTYSVDGAVLVVLLSVGTIGCAASVPGPRPHDMSTTQHESTAGQHELDAQGHDAQYQPAARVSEQRCRSRVRRRDLDFDSDVCWTSVVNPTESHLREAKAQRQIAAEHRAAATTLREAEARACVGIAPDDRDISPFAHVEDIVRVQRYWVSDLAADDAASTERTMGALVTFRPVEGMTETWLQKAIDCHLARNAALGHKVPSMPNCPLVPDNVTASVTRTDVGFVVRISSSDRANAREILERAERLLLPRAPRSSCCPPSERGFR